MIPRRLLFCMIVVVCLSLSPSVLANTTFNVSINTAAVSSGKGKLAFDLTTNNPGSSGNSADIVNFFAASGTLGLPQTQGGLVSGDLILGLNPAPLTRIESGFFFNELLLNYDTFGNTTTFTLELGENPPPSGPPDQFALFLLDANGSPLFPTSDPTGANALFAIDITGASGGALSIFSPTVFKAPNGIEVTVPRIGVTPEPSTLLLFGSALAGFAGAYGRKLLSELK